MTPPTAPDDAAPDDALDIDRLFRPDPGLPPDPDPLGRIGAGDPGFEAARRHWMQGAPLRQLFGDRLFEFTDTVGSGRVNRRGDVFRLQALLHREGALDAEATGGPTGYWGPRDDAALRRLQTEAGVAVDGWAGPGGETLRALQARYRPAAGDAASAMMATMATTPMTALTAPTAPTATPAGTPAGDDPWPDSPIHPDFRALLHKWESIGGNASGYDAENAGAYGRYQMRRPALIDAGMMNADGSWTGRHGIRSPDDFKRNPKAQEQAFADFMRRTEGYLQAEGLTKYIDRALPGRVATFPVTESGLAAAAHRQGAGMVKAYFDFKERTNWAKSDFSTIPEADRAAVARLQTGLKESDRQSAETVFSSVETRLREFSRIPYRRNPGS
jgi:hypothetical protein